MTELILKVLRIGVVLALAHTAAHNFPGGSVGYAHPELRRRGDQGSFTASTLRFVSNSHFRVVYPQSVDTEQVERVLNILESGRTELLHRASAAGIRTRIPLPVLIRRPILETTLRHELVHVLIDRIEGIVSRLWLTVR